MLEKLKNCTQLILVLTLFLAGKRILGCAWCFPVDYVLTMALFGWAVAKWISPHDGPWFHMKRWAFAYFLRAYQRNKKRRLPKYNIKENAFSSIRQGILPTAAETAYESNDQQENDTFEMSSFNDAGGLLRLRLRQLGRRQAEVELDYSETFFASAWSVVLPVEGSNLVFNIEAGKKDTIRAGGFTLVCIEPFRKWRVLFNGVMRKAENGEIQHFRFNLIYTPLNDPFDWATDSSVKPVADLMTRKGSERISEAEAKSDELLTGIDQYGVLAGLITDESGNEKEAYYRGVRRRVKSAQNVPVTKPDLSTLNGVSETGFQFTIRIGSIEGETYANGHAYIPGSGVYPITELDFPLNFDDLLSAWKAKSRKAQTVMLRFQAANKWFNVCLTLHRHARSVHSQHVTHTLIPVEITFNCVRGYAVFGYQEPRSVANTSDSQPEIVNFVTPSPGPIQEKNSPITVDLSSTTAIYEGSCGGKATSLACMMQCDMIGRKPGVSIPRGFVITKEAFEFQLENNQLLRDGLKDIETVAYKNSFSSEEEKRQKLEQTCKRVSEHIATTSLHPSIASKVSEHLKALESDSKKRYAVRSSAIGEDSEELSAAGQNETFLGCKSGTNIMDAIAKCWASNYAFQSVEYRRQNGRPVLVGMGVVVQEMVPAETAGVVFSRDPVTGNPTKVLITANFGLGESVVSAQCDPDSVTVNFRPWTSERFSIEDRKLGAKKKKVQMDGSEAVEEKQLTEEEASRLCLSDHTIVALAELAIELECMFGGPRDIEFAIIDNGQTICLLQARPITSFQTWTDYELAHELDTAIDSKLDVSTKANVGEVLPNSISPLTYSMVSKLLDLEMQVVRAREPGNEPFFGFCSTSFKAIILSQYQCLLQTTDYIYAYVESKDITKPVRAIDMSVFGHEVTREEDLDIAMDRRGIAGKGTILRRRMKMVADILRNVYWRKYGMSDIPDTKFLCKESWEPQQIFNEIEGGLEPFGRVFYRHLQTSHTGTTLSLIMFLTLAGNSDEWTNDLYSDAAGLLVSDEEDVESAGIPQGLKRLANMIRECASISEFCAMTAEEGENWLKDASKSSPSVARGYMDFKKRFHARCLREFDLISIPWGEDPSPLILTLQTMVKTEPNKATDAVRKTLEEKIDSLPATVDMGTRKALRYITPLAVAGVSLREFTKSKLINGVHELRVAMRYLARSLQRKGLIPEEQLAFYLTIYELKTLIKEGPNPALIQKAIRRRRLVPSLDALRFNEMNHGVPKPINDPYSPEETAVSSISSDEDGVVVRGTPVCKGTYEGVARVVTKLEDAKHIKKGEVLITISTDIGWSPYFPLLGGVVTELGGLISHGAVVAREYGLPCVVGAVGATSKFQTGQKVKIDGKKGQVSKCQD